MEFGIRVTALALLSFLGAGRTQENIGPYRANVFNAIYWLIRYQKPSEILRQAARQKCFRTVWRRWLSARHTV